MGINFDKIKLFKSINKSTEDFEKKFWKAKSAESLIIISQRIQKIQLH